MRNRLTGRFVIVVASTAFTLAMTAFSFSQTAPAAQNAGAGGGGRGGNNPAVNEPTPRLPDGTVNLGRAPIDVDGNWSLPYIQNMANNAANRPQQARRHH